MAPEEKTYYQLTPDIYEHMAGNRIDFAIQNDGVFSAEDYRTYLREKYQALSRTKNGRLKKKDFDMAISIIHGLRPEYVWDFSEAEILRALIECRKEQAEAGLDLTIVDKAIEETLQLFFEELSTKSDLN